MSYLLSTGLNSRNEDARTVVDAEGVRFKMSDGRWLIDASNTGGSLGHKHPAIVEAVQRAALSPTINEGWPWIERERAGEDLARIAFAADPDWFGAVRFCLSGSEANDLALSLAQAVTGRAALTTRERAYHGMTGLSRDMTVQPHWHGGLSSPSANVDPVPRTADVRTIPGPGRYRYGDSDNRAAADILRDVDDDLRASAAVLIDYSQGGVYYDPGYQDELARRTQSAGSLWIADEVVTGLGRYGQWFAFQMGSERPDIVTLGKHLGAGGAPVGAVVVSKRLLDRLGNRTWQTYSTFRGHPLSVACVRASLDVLSTDGLVHRASNLDGIIASRMAQIFEKHPGVSRIGGFGMHWSVELKGADWRQWRGVGTSVPLATRVAARAAEAGALIGTSGEATSLFLAPALTISEADLGELLDALDHGLTIADDALGDAAWQ